MCHFRTLCHLLCHCNHVKPDETLPNKPQRTPKKFTFQKVKDNRGREIRGLWVRNGRYYARLSVVNPKTGIKAVSRIPLEEATTVAQAKIALEELKKERRDDNLRPIGQSPYLEEFVETYFSMIQGKKSGTIRRERGSMRHWIEFLGQIRLSAITTKHIYGFIAKRKEQGVTNRTVNLDLVAMNQVLKKAKEFHHIRKLPTEDVRQLRHVSRKRPLLDIEDIEAICSAGLAHSKNGVQFSDYVHFMAYCGARRAESLNVRWSDVDFDRKLLTIGSDGNTKNHQSRQVNFNPSLEALLTEMLTRKAPDSDWLFPSPQRGDRDIAAKNFGESLNIARDKSKVDLNFHDLRHFFCSTCVMAGIDYMTIAKWVGHQDGGILIGKTYGHLSDDHARKQAAKVTF